MRPARIVTDFRTKVLRIRRLVHKQSSLFAVQSISKTELQSIYELAYLRVFISFENSLVELLKTNLMMETGSDGRKRSYVKPDSRASAFRVLIGANRYFSAMPVEQLEKVAKSYLKDGKPFTLLPEPRRAEVRKAYVIRNHIAHRSQDSKEKFSRSVIASATLLRNTTIPGVYLSASQTASMTYFDHHVSEMGAVLKFYCDNT